MIGAGEPPACLPRPLLTVRDGRTEAPLAADSRPLRDGGSDGPEKGVVRLIAGLLDVPFDDLWRREERRRRARRLMLAAQLIAAAFAALLLILLVDFYRTHALVDMDLSSLQSIATNVEVIGAEQTPEQNAEHVFVRRKASPDRMRMWVPATNVILRVHARYRDGADRALAMHLTPRSGFDPRTKRLRFALPSREEILGHPRMAHVPAVQWIHGLESARRTNATPFWIDIRPPTVAEYVPIARRLVHEGRLAIENSLNLTARQQRAGIEATGLTQLHPLGDNLGAIFGVIEQASSPNVSAPGDIAVGLLDESCPSCPAPMTRHEAEVYCTSRGMRLPTAMEWELAVRGVDGRVYPWGSRFDETRANVCGLPDKGEPSPALKPVDAYRAQVSPFGLVDTVGNAGDWVINDIASYERVYMGATYRFNPEDATAFRMLPVTDEDSLVREITARCLDGDGK